MSQSSTLVEDRVEPFDNWANAVFRLMPFNTLLVKQFRATKKFGFHLAWRMPS